MAPVRGQECGDPHDFLLSKNLGGLGAELPKNGSAESSLGRTAALMPAAGIILTCNPWSVQPQ